MTDLFEILNAETIGEKEDLENSLIDYNCYEEGLTISEFLELKQKSVLNVHFDYSTYDDRLAKLKKLGSTI